VSELSPQVRTNTTAILAAIAGILGFCFWGIGGVVAVVLGVAARAEIGRSAGREGGMAIAIVGIALGTLNVASCVVAMGIGITLALRPPPASAPPVAAPLAKVPPKGAAPGARSAAPEPARAPTFNHESGAHEVDFGRVRLVHVSPDPSKPLRQMVEQQLVIANEHHERLLVFVVLPNCLPCNGLSLVIEDGRLQTALQGVRVVRVDASDFGPQLLGMGIPIETVPGFALMTAGLRAADYIHGGEWDADVPENIAPVLGAFVRGKYLKRRHPIQTDDQEERTTL
jgi:hypothetical protein